MPSIELPKVLSIWQLNLFMVVKQATSNEFHSLSILAYKCCATWERAKIEGCTSCTLLSAFFIESILAPMNWMLAKLRWKPSSPTFTLPVWRTSEKELKASLWIRSNALLCTSSHYFNQIILRNLFLSWVGYFNFALSVFPFWWWLLIH